MVFKLGCLAAVLTAMVHLAAHMLGPQPPVDDTEREVMRLVATHEFPFPGGSQRTLMDLMDGFSLTYAVLLATVGGIGYVVQKRSRDDAILMTALSRTLAAACAVMLVISLTHFFIVPTLFIALMTVCFALASVRAPAN